MIKCVLFDIDGVITNGLILIDQYGNEQKQINLKDIDAIYELKRGGFIIGAITGENSQIVQYFKNRLPWDYFFADKKNKLETIKFIEGKEGLSPSEICYVGDSIYDTGPLDYVGLPVCFNDAINRVKGISKLIIDKPSGTGGLWDLVDYILSM